MQQIQMKQKYFVFHSNKSFIKKLNPSGIASSKYFLIFTGLLFSILLLLGMIAAFCYSNGVILFIAIVSVELLLIFFIWFTMLIIEKLYYIIFEENRITYRMYPNTLGKQHQIKYSEISGMYKANCSYEMIPKAKGEPVFTELDCKILFGDFLHILDESRKIVMVIPYSKEVQVFLMEKCAEHSIMLEEKEYLKTYTDKQSALPGEQAPIEKYHVY